jgi:hypothetical protein
LCSWTELPLIAEELFMPLALDQVFSLKRCLNYVVHGHVTWACTKGVPSWQPLLKRCVMSDEQEQDLSPLMPIEQQTIMFYGKPLVVVRLPDGRPGIVLRHLCDNLQLEPTSQVSASNERRQLPMTWCIL